MVQVLIQAGHDLHGPMSLSQRCVPGSSDLKHIALQVVRAKAEFSPAVFSATEARQTAMICVGISSGKTLVLSGHFPMSAFRFAIMKTSAMRRTLM